MHWSFAHFTFNTERGILHNGEVEVLLKPKASALLSYFCQNHQRDISRGELIEHVWHGQIVSDNAINRVVVKLRKALGDELKPRRFIATVPKVGYRFISQPQVVETAAESQVVSESDRRPAWVLPTLGLLALTVFVTVLTGNRSSKSSAPVSIQPVSRETGWQFDADLSPNEQHLLFSVTEARGNILYLQNLAGDQLTQISPDTGNAGGGRWSHDGAYFVYIYHQGDNCSFHRVHVDTAGEVENNELLQTCNLNSDTSFALSLDDEILYFVERPNAFSPYVAFAFDMQEQQRWRLAQPVATSYGNHYLDVHPVTGKVLLLSEPKPGASALYEIDVPRNEYRRIQSFDYDLYSAIWGHQPNVVVHPAEHPSYQLLQTDLVSGQSQVLVSDSRRISTPRRINNDTDYLFASYLYNRDIDIEGYDGAHFNSAVMDYLPEFSNSGSRLAFVSKRSGYSEVFVLDTDTQQLLTLETEDQGITYYNLSWSSDDRSLVANTSKGIIIYGLERSSQRIIPIDQLTYAVDWYSDTQLSYSHYVDGKWRAIVHDIDSGDKTQLEEGVIFVLTDSNEHLHISSGSAATVNRPMHKQNLYDLADCGNRYIGRFQSNLKFKAGRAFCPDPGNSDRLLVIEPGQAASVYSENFADAEFYSVSKTRLARSRVESASSDVMRTRSE